MSKAISTMGSMRILGSGMAVPECPSPQGPKPVISNADVAAILAATAASDRQRRAIERLLEESGCQQRHWSHWVGAPPAPEEPTTAELATTAARAALGDAGLQPDDLDLVILALSSSTLPTIATATPVCAALGYAGPSFDLKAGCAGSLYALQLAVGLLSGACRRILVIGADTMSKYVDPQALLGFTNVGDGAGALVLGRAASPNYRSLISGEYGTWDTAGVFDVLPPQGGADFAFRGKPGQLKELISQRYRESLQQVLADQELGFADLVGWVPHQIAPAILREVWTSFEAPHVPLCLNHERYGNTGAGSILIALHEFRSRLGRGWTALSALGGGMRWGSALWRDPFSHE